VLKELLCCLLIEQSVLIARLSKSVVEVNQTIFLIKFKLIKKA